MAGDPATRLDIESIARDLEVAGVRYVLTGSVAAAAYGVPVEPRDFDIAPDLDPDNLSRLADVLRRWDAKPMPDPLWPESLSLEECQRWTPDPPTAEHLDHLLTTPHGLFDVVPTRSIGYTDLIARALPLVYEGRTILVAHPADLIAALRMHNTKHQVRLPQLSAILERLSRGETIGWRMPS
jgi:hypothetical protein